MNRLQVELGKLERVAQSTSKKLGFTKGSISPEVDGTVFLCLWQHGDIVASGYANGTPKAIKEKILEMSIKQNSKS